MYPTKAFDSYSHRQEQALRHARVLDAAMANGNIAGCFQWCMFDYATHKDFGSGDRNCYHGVMDFFRNPKLAAYTYASQGDDTPVLELGSSFDIGDYPAGQKGAVYAFTNADEIRLYKNDKFVKAFAPGEWDCLLHGPVEIDDMIGDLLESEEGFEPKKASLIRSCLLSAEKHGFQTMPLFDKLKMLYVMMKYKLSYAEGVTLYGKYVSNWGGESTRWRIDAIRNGEVMKSRICTPGNRLHLEATASQLNLIEGDCYDMSLVRIRIVDENGNPAPYAQMPVVLATEGVIHVVGPQVITAEGGMCGCLVRTDGWGGDGRLIIYTESGLETSIDFSVFVAE